MYLTIQNFTMRMGNEKGYIAYPIIINERHGGRMMEMNKERIGMEYWKKIIILLCSGWVSIWIYRSALSPVYPQINASLGGNV